MQNRTVVILPFADDIQKWDEPMAEYGLIYEPLSRSMVPGISITTVRSGLSLTPEQAESLALEIIGLLNIHEQE
jgi:hypothetical protein